MKFSAPVLPLFTSHVNHLTCFVNQSATPGLPMSNMRAALCKYAAFLKLMQAYRRFMAALFIKQRQPLHRLRAEGMSREDGGARLFQLLLVVCMDREQGLALLDLISYLAMDEQ